VYGLVALDGFVWKDSDKLQATSCKPKAQIRSQKIRSQEPAVYGLVWWDGFIFGAVAQLARIGHNGPERLGWYESYFYIFPNQPF
jgi:hypothetical protein